MSNLPADLVRPDVLLLVGEDSTECAALLGLEWAHAYRGFHGAVQDDRLVLMTPFGSSAMESVLWELAPRVRRIILAGTAGALGGFEGQAWQPLAVASATPCYQSFDGPPIAYTPSLQLDLPGVDSVSTDRFYGFSPLTESNYPAEPGLQEAWQRLGGSDAIVEMEVAAFFHYCERFGKPDLQYAAVKVVANAVDDLDSLPGRSARAMQVALDAVIAAF